MYRYKPERRAQRSRTVRSFMAVGEHWPRFCSSSLSGLFFFSLGLPFLSFSRWMGVSLFSEARGVRLILGCVLDFIAMFLTELIMTNYLYAIVCLKCFFHIFRFFMAYFTRAIA